MEITETKIHIDSGSIEAMPFQNYFMQKIVDLNKFL